MPSKISLLRSEAGSRFAGLLAACFDGVVVEPPLDDCQANIDRDEVLLDHLLGTGAHLPVIRVWQNGDCLVVPRTVTREPEFACAAKNCPLPVVNRVSGGTAVIHGPHIVNISIAARVTDRSLPGYYAPITDIILPALRSLGQPATIGSVKGAHCDGRFNICLSHRKIGGTAAFVRSRGKDMATLAHASITVEQSNQDLGIIERFEHDLGQPNRYRHQAHTSVYEEFGNQSVWPTCC